MDIVNLKLSLFTNIFIFTFDTIKIIFNFIVYYNLATPITLTTIAFFVTKKIDDRKFEINVQNNQEEILEKYLENIERLLLYENKSETMIVSIVEFRTLTVLRRLKSLDDKSIILKFLYHTGLISYEKNRNNIFLYLGLCDFQNVKLKKTNLQGIYLQEANLKGANLEEANLQGAKLKGANLQKANLKQANLLGADLFEANLPDIKQLKLANNWNQAVYTQAVYSIEKKIWVPKDKEANNAKIIEIETLN